VAFFDEEDLKPKQQPAQPQVIIQQAPRSKLLPALLITLNVGVVVVLLVLALPNLNIKWPTGGSTPGNSPTVDVAELDPELLMTPSGRQLNVQQFGGYMFEITRLMYSNNPNQRSVTITVPGKPPQQGMFRTGESFAGGALRIVDIQPQAVVLAHNGEQQTFPVEGADLNQVWGTIEPKNNTADTGSGTTMIPALNRDIVPNLNPGQVRAPRDPRATPDPERASHPEDGTGSLLSNRDDEGIALEDLPEERVIGLGREEYNTLIRTLPDLFERDFVFGTIFEQETRQPYGLEVKNLHPESIFRRYGMSVGDVIVGINDHDIRRVRDLDLAARSNNSYRDRLEIYVWRGEDVLIFHFHPGTNQR
jgi:hypothetical protein